MLQLNKRIGQLQNYLLSERENPTERESQAKILLQDIEAFQQEISELRASDAASGEIGDIAPLAETAESMHEKVKGSVDQKFEYLNDAFLFPSFLRLVQP